MVFANNVDDVPKAIEEVKTVIRKRHKNQDEFVRIFEMRAGMAQLQKISKMIKIALGSIAGFSAPRWWYRHYEYDVSRCHGANP